MTTKPKTKPVHKNRQQTMSRVMKLYMLFQRHRGINAAMVAEELGIKRHHASAYLRTAAEYWPIEREESDYLCGAGMTPTYYKWLKR